MHPLPRKALPMQKGQVHVPGSYDRKGQLYQYNIYSTSIEAHLFGNDTGSKSAE